MGWDCALYHPVATSMWVPMWSAANARSILGEVSCNVHYEGTLTKAHTHTHALTHTHMHTHTHTYTQTHPRNM